jgi:rubrerythrin
MDELGKKMFMELAKEEEQHYMALKTIFEQRESRILPKEINAVVGKTNVRNVLLGFLRQVRTDVKTTEDDKAAIKTAIEFEEKGVIFYQRLSKEANSPEEKSFFELLASMEREHLISLKESLEYFEDPAGYFQKTERGVLDGA